MIQVTEQELDVAAHIAAAIDDKMGAQVTFIGQIRNHDPGVPTEVSAIDYSAHPDAETILKTIISEVQTEFPCLIAASHRIGHLVVGDIALVVVVSAPHRSQAYEVSRNVVERIKAELPIWKKQHDIAGESHWSGL